MEVATLKTFGRRLLEALLLTAALLSPLIARVARAGVTPVHSTACMKSAPSGSCLFGSSHAGLALKMDGMEIAAEWIDGRSAAASNIYVANDQVVDAIHVAPTVSLTMDLHQRVREGNLSAEEALLIETELFARRDASYFLPDSVEQLKAEVGFAPEAALSAQDSIDLVNVHIQLALSVSPATAAYLADRLGVMSEEPGSSEGQPSSTPVEPANQEQGAPSEMSSPRETASVVQTQS